MEGDGEGDGGETDASKRDEITQRILNIMANFLEGEVHNMYLHVHVPLCTVSVHTRSLLFEGELITFLSLLFLFFSSH